MRKFAVYLSIIFVIAAVLLPPSSVAQESSNPNSHNDNEMDMPGMNAMSSNQTNMQPHSLIEAMEQHATSGTDAEPNSTPLEMVMHKQGKWMLMFHGEVFVNELQQTGSKERRLTAAQLFTDNIRMTSSWNWPRSTITSWRRIPHFRSMLRRSAILPSGLQLSHTGRRRRKIPLLRLVIIFRIPPISRTR